jgi:hypothetical protein
MTLYSIITLFILLQPIGNSENYQEIHPAFHPYPTESEKFTQEPHERKKFFVDGAPNLTVFTVSGDIEVVHDPDIDHVLVELYVRRGYSIWAGRKNIDNYRIVMLQRGDQINASVQKKRSEGSWIGDNISFTFVVHTPKDLTSNLRTMDGSVLLQGVKGRNIIHTNAGNITLRDIEGEIQANSSGGGVGIAGSSGQFNIRTIVGNINIEQSKGEIRARTVSGNIMARDVIGTLVCATASGNVNASFLDVSYGIHVESASGNIELTLPGRTGYQLNARGANIDLVHFQPFDGVVRGSSASGRVGDGSVPLQLSTASGTVVLKKDGFNH